MLAKAGRAVDGDEVEREVAGVAGDDVDVDVDVDVDDDDDDDDGIDFVNNGTAPLMSLVYCCLPCTAVVLQ